MQKAFTLIELLISIAIIGILSGLAAVSYSGIQQRGRDAQRKSDLGTIKVALSSYYNAQYPMKYYPSSSALTITGSDGLSTALQNNYIRAVPNDPLYPQTNFSYLYQSSTTVSGVGDQAFTLSATLENKLDKKGWTGNPAAWAPYGYVVQND